jgi:C4-dicarboxylate-specific signal transduction histidine kinase
MSWIYNKRSSYYDIQNQAMLTDLIVRVTTFDKVFMLARQPDRPARLWCVFCTRTIFLVWQPIQTEFYNRRRRYRTVPQKSSTADNSQEMETRRRQQQNKEQLRDRLQNKIKKLEEKKMKG